MADELSFSDYKKAHEEILKAMEENKQSFEMALLLHDQGIVTEKTKENVTKANVLIWVLEKFKNYEIEESRNPQVEAKNI